MLDPAQYVSSYELLRAQIIGVQTNPGRASAAGESRGAGLALLLFEGMPAWINALDGVIRASGVRTIIHATEQPAAESPSAYDSAPACLSSALCDDLTVLLTNLVLSTRGVEQPIPGRDIHHANEW